MKNFLKGLGFLTPTILATVGVVYCCVHDPIVITILKIISEVFCGSLAIVILFFFILLTVWGLKNAFIHIFKIKFNLKV
jgi:hypothetical protein